MRDWKRYIESTTNPKVTAGIVACFNDKQQFLIVKRSSTDRIHPGYWEWPGGHVDDDDHSIESGSARELQEEANVTCKVEDLKYFAVQKFKRPAVEDPNKDLQVTRYFYITTKWTGEAKIVPNPTTGILEHDDLRWATKEEILSLENTEITDYLLDKALSMVTTDEGLSSNDPRNKEKDKAGRNRSRPDRIREAEDEECDLQDEGLSSNDPRNKEKDKAGRNRSHKDRIREEEELEND